MHKGSEQLILDLRRFVNGDFPGCYYGNEEERREVLNTFIAGAIQAEQKVIAYTGVHQLSGFSGSSEDADPVNSRITAFQDMARADILSDIDAFLDHLNCEMNKAFQNPCKGTRICLDMNELPGHFLSNGSYRKFMRRLLMLDRANECIIMCLYKRKKTSPDVIAESLSFHPHVIIGGNLFNNSYFMPVEEDCDYDPKADTMEKCLDELAEGANTKQELRDLKEKYRFVFENTSDFLCFHDMDGIIKEINLVDKEVEGFTEQSLIGLNFRDLIPKKYRHGFNDYLDKLKGEGRTEGILRLSGKNGNEHIFEYTCELVSGESGPIGVRGLSKDITERFKAREALRRSEERFRDLFENVTDFVYFHDIEGDFDFEETNKAFQEKWGYTGEKNRYGNIRNFIPNKFKPGFSEYLKRLKETGSDEGLLSVILADGKEHILEYKNSLVCRKGMPVLVRGIARDITERINTERRLRKSEERYRSIFNSVSDFLYFHDLEGFFNCEECNFAVKDNWSKLSVGGRRTNIRDIIPERYRSRFNDYLKKVTVEGKDEGLLCVITKDGQEHILEYKNALVHDKKGNPVSVRGLARDITDRIRAERQLRKSEAKYRTILESIEEGYYEVDLKGNLTFSNDSISRILGFSREELTGMNYRRYMNEENARKVFQTYHRIFETGHPEKGFDWEFIRKDGRTVQVETSIQFIKDGGGNPIGFRGVIRDVSERKQAEEFKAAKQKAEAENKAKSDFLANMSHEIRTPLNGIIGMTELAMDLPMDQKQKDIVKVINRESETLLSLINDILDFSKIEADRYELEEIPFNLRELVEDLAHSFAIRSEKKGLEFISYISPEVPSHLMGDPGRLRQVITNLAGNALKFTDKGEIFVNVAMEEDLGDRVRLKFNVKDTGIGIPADKKDKIFESFTQADGSITRKYGGTGLGLAISKRIVKMMHGEIEVESTWHEGSNFFFTAVFSRQKDRKVCAQSDFIDLKGLRVLIVDDNETSRFILREYLKSWDCIPVDTPGGEKAISLLLEGVSLDEPFDLILMDYRMPEIDGIELTGKIRAEELLSTIPVILLTTSMENLREEKTFRDFSIQGYLPKPARRDDLRKAIISVMGLSQSQEPEERPELMNKDAIPDDFRKHVRILIAEDYPTNQQIAVRHLHKAGYQVEIAENGEQAVSAFAENHYDLILMDVQMPIMNGYEATRKIREWEERLPVEFNLQGTGKPNKVPIIAMTAHAITGYREKCIEAGMDDYLAKPLRREELTGMVDKWIRKCISAGENTEIRKRKDHVTMEKRRAPIDMERVMSEFDVDREFLKEILGGFLHNARDQIQNIRKAFQQRDAEVIRKEAHSIKGAAANICADDLAQAALEMEMLGKSGKVDNGENILQRMEEDLIRLEEFERTVLLVE